MQKVETIKPVEKTTAKWVEKREAIETPKIVRRKVAFTTTKKVPYTVKMRQRIDSYGNSIGDPEPVDPEWQAWFKARQEQGQPVSLKPASDGASISINSVLEKEQADTDPTFQPRHPVPEADTVPTLKEKPTSPTSVTPIAPPSARDNRVRSILVPETRGDFTASTNMRKLGGPSLMIETSTDSREASKRVPGATAVPTNSTGGVANTDPVSAIPRSDGKTETSLNSAWKVFDPELIKPPTVPTSGTVPKSGDDLSVDDLDRVECPQRQPVKDIY